MRAEQIGSVPAFDALCFRSDDDRLRAIRDLRSDHAGETGAVFIYRGVLAFSRDEGVRDFAERHAQTEQRHLDIISEILPRKRRSILIPLWKVAGWITGAVPAIMGPRAVYATVEAVETFVEEHYQEQIDFLTKASADPHLIGILKECQADEIAHKEEAAQSSGDRPPFVLRVWTALVGLGSAQAVSLARAF